MTLKNTNDTNAVFTIKNNQTYDSQSDLLEITTEGSFYFRGGTYFLMYKEYTELGIISVLIRAANDTVSIRRSGSCSARMEYERGTHREILYKVPYGEMVIGLDTEEVKNSLNLNGGKLELKYRLTINDEVYHNDMTLEVNINSKT